MANHVRLAALRAGMKATEKQSAGTTIPRAIYSALGSAAAVEAAETAADAAAAAASSDQPLHIPCGVLARFLDHPAIPGLGERIVRLAFANVARPDYLAPSDLARGIEACCSGSREQRLCVLFSALADESWDGSDSTSLAALFSRCYALETGHVAAAGSDYAFRSAAGSAAMAVASAHRNGMAAAAATQTDGRPSSDWARALAMWAAGQLPGLHRLLASYVERRCVESEGLDLAVAMQEAAQRKRGVCRQLSLDELLLLPPDEARRRLRQQASASAAAPASAPAPTPAPATEPPCAPPAADEVESMSTGGVEAPLMSPAFLWLVSHAVDLPGGASDWSALFSSDNDGRSLHTLAERTSGFAQGTLVVCRDSAAFVFGAWAPRGINPNPPSATAPPRAPDFTGTDATVLLRLLPSLLVVRTRRTIAAAEKGHPPLSAAGAAAASLSAGGAQSVPADQRYLYFNNRRTGRRGIGLGGSLRRFRLYVDASLESGTCLNACETYADGALASAESFEVRVIEVWGCGGRDAVLQQEMWKEDQVEMRRRSVRRAIAGDDDDDDAHGEKRGVASGTMGKEDRWMLGLIGWFGGGFHGRDPRQDAAYPG